MRSLVVLAALFALAVAGPVRRDVVPDEYIVVFDAAASPEERVAHMATLSNSTQVFKHFEIEDFRAYHARMSENDFLAVQAHSAVAYAQPNGIVYASEEEERAGGAACTTQFEATWGLVRTNIRDLDLDGIYNYHLDAGEEVNAYVIDTGVYTEHVEFEGRATFGTDTVDNPPVMEDSNGHGTHVAGTIGGKTYGLAKQVKVIGVKVLSKSGYGSDASVIAGVEWSANDHKKKKKPSVANMSLGGGYSKAINDAVNAGVKAGVVFVVAAGNENTDACSKSPASASSPITVGSSTNKDARSYFSNYGKCVDIFAPGSDITSAWISGKYSINTISGTSMASPHIAGLAAKYLTENPSATPAQVKSALASMATKDALTDVKSGSPNLLGFVDCA